MGNGQSLDHDRREAPPAPPTHAPRCPDPAELVNQVEAARRGQRLVHQLIKSAPRNAQGDLQPATDGFGDNVEYRFFREARSRLPVRDSQDATYDYIIVGAGAAGCTLAHELIKSEPRLRILLLEAGPPQAFANDRIHAPFTCSTLWKGHETDWGYMTEAHMTKSIVPNSNMELTNPAFFFPRGKVLGGSTATNAMIYIRGQPQDYDKWGQGGPEYSAIWNWQSCLDAFKATEHNLRTEPDVEFLKYHGFAGHLYVQDSNAGVYEISQAIVDLGVQTSGLPENLDMNGAHQKGVGKFQVTMKNGRRCTVSDTFLRSAVDHRVELTPDNAPLPPGGTGKLTGLIVKSNCHVKNLIFDSNNSSKVIGVEYAHLQDLSAPTVYAEREVILAAGAINTPQILMLSGIVPEKPKVMNMPKVMKIHVLPGVGKNLMDHPLVPVTASVAKPMSTMQSNIHIWSNGPEVAYMFKADELGMSKDVDFTDAQPDIQINCAPSIWDQAIIQPIRGGPAPFAGDGITYGIVLNAPLSKGSVELASNDFLTPPKIYTNYYTNPSDMKRMISAVRFSRDQIQKLPQQPWEAKLLGWDDQYGKYDVTDEGIERYIINKTYTSFHPCGTCKMAPLEDGGVVNERLKVHDIEGLRVVDASIFPIIPTGNLQAAVIMMAYKAAQLILNEHQ